MTMCRELARVNGSMFSVSNPITAKRRQRAADAAVLERHHMERDTRKATRGDAYAAQQGVERTFMELEREKPRHIGAQHAAQKNNKFLYVENDSDDNEEAKADEDKLIGNLGEIEIGVGTLNKLAKEMGTEIRGHTNLVDRIADKVSCWHVYSVGCKFANIDTERPRGRSCK